ncbi:MAG: MFS transporter [Porticoccaceae bacterium]|nr:MFS transporter [Pseudomonadales bacterium]
MKFYSGPPAAVPYWRLSGFYFCFFALLGATFPYWSLYLKSLGYTSADIGVLLSIPMATKVFAPSIWGWLADHTGRHLTIIRLGCLLATVSFMGLFISQSFWPLLFVMTSYSFFWNAVLPQHETITVSYLSHRPETYSHIRLWGSVGFILAVLIAGWWFDEGRIGSLPVVGTLLLASIWLSSMIIPAPTHFEQQKPATHFLKACFHPALLAFLVSGFLLQLAHGIYYSFFSIHLEAEGYSRVSIGFLWAVGVAAEVLVFLAMHSLLPRIGVRQIMLFSLLMATVRWFLIGHFAEFLWLLLIAQLLHAFTFGTFHASAIECVRRLFEPAHQGKGQAIYSGVSFGAGGASGSLLGGIIWDIEPTWAYDLGSAVSLLALLVVGIWMRDQRLKN